MVMAFATSVAAQSPAAGGKITVAVSSSPSATALRAIGDQFTKDTGITVEFADIPYAQIAPKVLLQAKDNPSAYDVIQFDSPMLAPLVAGGALAKLDDRINASTEYDNADFPAQVQEYASYQGTRYGLPLSTEPYILWYRTDLLDQAGLKVPTTYDEMIANAEKLTANGVYGSDSGFGAEIGAYYWLEAVYNFGGKLFDPDTCTPTLDSPEAKAATEAYAKLLPFTPPSAVNGGGNEMTTAFIQGLAAQEINATGYYSIMADPAQSKVVDKFKAALVPAANGVQQTLLFGWLIGQAANSANPDLAWKFLEYAMGKTNASKLIELGAPPPARLSLLNDPNATTKLPYLPVLIEAAKQGTHLPYVPTMSQIITALSIELNKLGAGQVTVDQLLANANAQVKSIFDDAGGCK